MLYKIKSDAFKYNDGTLREEIIFDNGLNIILGDDSAKNAIGKSSFMLIIDYVLGGDDYINKVYKPDVSKEIGDHDIFFTYKFDKEYHFMRKTSDISNVYICDENYSVVREISIKDFREFLKKQYEIPHVISFREAINTFVRVFRKSNYNYELPLKSFETDTLEKGIDRLVKIFNKYDIIEKSKDELNTISSQFTTFDKALKFNFITGASTKKVYDDNLKQIRILEQQKIDIIDQSELGVEEITGLEAETIAGYKKSISKLKYQKSCLITKKLNIKNNFKKSSKLDLDELESFFPNANIKKINEVETFHNKIASFIVTQGKEQIKQIDNEIKFIDLQVAEVEALLEKYKSISSVAVKKLTSYAEIDHKLQILKNANEAFERKKEMKADKGKAQINVNEKINEVSEEISPLLNESMDEIAKSISISSQPKINLIGSKQYTFTTDKDKSTGNAEKSLVIFDLAILELTNIPLVVHDSIMLKQIEVGSMESLISTYDSSSKQIIIALDQKDTYDTDTVNLILSKTKLKLDHNNVLYGKDWSSRLESEEN